MGLLADSGGWDTVFQILLVTAVFSAVVAGVAVVFRLIHVHQEKKIGKTI